METKNIEKEDEYQDCMACKVTGTLTAFSIAGYCQWERKRMPLPINKTQNRMLNGITLGN